MSELKKYLDYYSALKAPSYAVLVAGAWGVGKTYQVKKALEKSKHYYVSLFGLESKEAIETALLTEANPSLKKRKDFLKFSTSQAKDVGGLYGLIGIIPSAINSLLKIELDPEAVIIFDDLERSTIKPTVVLGILNWFIEHQGCKVVVIADDKKLKKKILNQTEKLFGHTINVKPEMHKAFWVFLREIENSIFMAKDQAKAASKFLRKNREVIFSVFREQTTTDEQDRLYTYETNSLRILRRSMFDAARIFSIIDSKYLNNDEAMNRLILEFCVFNLEYRKGSLPSESLGKNWGEEHAQIWRRRMRDSGDEQIPFSPLEKIERKYSEINLDSMLINHNILYETIVEGNFDKTHLTETLEASSYFVSVKNQPAWRRFMAFDENDDESVEDAKNELLEQFKNREVFELGAMQHMFALRFMMSEHDIITDDFDAVEQSCRAYIEDLVLSGELLPTPPNIDFMDRYYRESSHGHSYWVEDNYRQKFLDIQQYLRDSRDAVFESQAHDIGGEILTALREDSDVFTKLISHRLGEGKYASVPVMRHINATEFVETWLSLPKLRWRSVQYAIYSRYEHNRLADDGLLVAEQEWVLQMREVLQERADDLNGYQKLRISRIIPTI